MSFINSILVLAGALYVSSCGFSPLYGPQSSNEETAQIKVDLIPDRPGQMLRNYLLDIFNPYGKPTFFAYRLQAVPTITKEEFGFRRDATSKRTRLTATIDFTLFDTSTGKPLYQDKVEINSGFSVGSKAETASLPQVVSEEDAIRRSLEQGAREVKLLITSYLHSHASPQNLQSAP